jgi:hypothetical protein
VCAQVTAAPDVPIGTLEKLPLQTVGDCGASTPEHRLCAVASEPGQFLKAAPNGGYARGYLPTHSRSWPPLVMVNAKGRRIFMQRCRAVNVRICCRIARIQLTAVGAGLAGLGR